MVIRIICDDDSGGTRQLIEAADGTCYTMWYTMLWCVHNALVQCLNNFMCIFLNKTAILSLGNGVKHYYMVASDVSDVPNGRK